MQYLQLMISLNESRMKVSWEKCSCLQMHVEVWLWWRGEPFQHYQLDKQCWMRWLIWLLKTPSGSKSHRPDFWIQTFAFEAITLAMDGLVASISMLCSSIDIICKFICNGNVVWASWNWLLPFMELCLKVFIVLCIMGIKNHLWWFYLFKFDNGKSFCKWKYCSVAIVSLSSNQWFLMINGIFSCWGM